MIYISINGGTIRKNALRGTREPPIRVARSRNDKKPVYGQRVWVDGPVELVYTPRKKILACGARLVMQTERDVMVSSKSACGPWTLVKNGRRNKKTHR